MDHVSQNNHTMCWKEASLLVREENNLEEV